MVNSVSYYDTLNENFYHGLLLGLCALLNGVYISSNKEAGDGRLDIELMPKNNELPGVIIELRYSKTKNNLKQLAKEAIKQIDDNNYDVSLKKQEIKKIIKYGVAFSRKEVEIIVE